MNTFFRYGLIVSILVSMWSAYKWHSTPLDSTGGDAYQWANITKLIAYAMQAYASENEGKQPSKWEDLDPYLSYWHKEWEERTGFKIRDDTYTYFSGLRPVMGTQDGQDGQEAQEIVVMTAYVIIQKRLPGKWRGRYVVYRRGGGVGSKWLAESDIQAAARVANVPAPSTGDHYGKWKPDTVVLIGYAAGALIPFFAIGICILQAREGKKP